MGLYDRLFDQLDDDDNDQNDDNGDEQATSSGVTPLEIAGLPGPQRKVMFWMLRDAKASSEGVNVERLRANLEDDVEDLPTVLAELTKESWLILMGEPPNVRYKVNLRRKRGSSLDANVWASLTDRLLADEDDDDGSEDDPPGDPDQNGEQDTSAKPWLDW
jgi:hypothetical protein